MLYLNETETRAAMPFPELINALREIFRSECVVPLRHHHEIDIPDAPGGILLLMPCWIEGDVLGVKQVCMMPGNSASDMPSVIGTYILSDARTGAVLAILDGSEMTARRTAAASALAADYLARPDAAHLLVVGTGRVSANLIAAYQHVRPLTKITVWGRDVAKAQALTRRFSSEKIAFSVAPDLESAVREADIVSCATLSHEPLIAGEWLSPGCHLDLVGGFTPVMREADDEAVRRASVFVDTRAAALVEAGDIIQPMDAGVIAQSDIRADLYDLCLGRHTGRTSADEITFFKSVGAALEDLAAAKLAVSNLVN